MIVRANAKNCRAVSITCVTEAAVSGERFEPLVGVGRMAVSKGDSDPMTTNLETVQQAYAAFAKGDVAGILATLDANAVWDNPGPSSIAYFGSHRGHAAIASNIFGFLHENLQFSVFQPLKFFESGDTVAVLLDCEATVTRTGTQLKQAVVHLFTFAGGKVVRFQDFQNSWAIAKALGA